MENNKNDYKIGVFTGIGSAVTWGIDTVLVALILAMSPFSSEGAGTCGTNHSSMFS